VKNYITIEGNIGAGKTTLAQNLCEKLGAFFIPEEFENNPLLNHFYEKPDQFSFSLEFSFLLDRYRQLFSLKEKINHSFCISDFSFDKCLLFANLNLKAEEKLFFKKQFDFLKSDLPTVDTRIFIHLSSENAMKNINKRGRKMEQSLSLSYLKSIGDSYLNLANQTYPGNTLLFMMENGNAEAYKQVFEECVSVLKSDYKFDFKCIYV
jgi:deoxyadenosine/deoxycytidine kinase